MRGLWSGAFLRWYDRSDETDFRQGAPCCHQIDRQQAPYVESKPFHKSQKVEQRFRDGSIQLSLKVVINNELERLILGYGGHVEVIVPPEFRSRIAESIFKAASNYKLPQ